MTAERPPPELIVNADDFGLSDGVNRGIVRAREQGIVTSASLMTRGAAAENAARYARDTNFGVGLHFDLGEWQYVDGRWISRYEVADLTQEHAVRDEMHRQLERFVTMLGTRPTHIDSHQHVHRQEPVRSVTAAVAGELGVPLREVNGGVRYCGAFYGQTAEGYPLPDAITVEALTKILANLPPAVTELGCHPGYAEDLPTSYGSERAREVSSLCDPRVRMAVDALGIRLRSFADISKARAHSSADESTSEGPS